MSKKNHIPGPIPPANRSPGGPAFEPDNTEDQPAPGNVTEPRDQEQDESRRLGGFVGKGEHAIQQPGRLNDGDTHSQ